MATGVMAMTLAAADARAETTGDVRAAYIDGAVTACLQTQTGAPENKGTAQEYIDGYCRCLALYGADRSTNDQVKQASGALERGEMPQWIADLTLKGADYCRSNLSSFVPTK